MIGGEKYIALRADDRSVYGKKGAGGVINVKTKQAIIVAVYDDKTQPGEGNSWVEVWWCGCVCVCVCGSAGVGFHG